MKKVVILFLFSILYVNSKSQTLCRHWINESTSYYGSDDDIFSCRTDEDNKYWDLFKYDCTWSGSIKNGKLDGEGILTKKYKKGMSEEKDNYYIIERGNFSNGHRQGYFEKRMIWERSYLDYDNKNERIITSIYNNGVINGWVKEDVKKNNTIFSYQYYAKNNSWNPDQDILLEIKYSNGQSKKINGAYFSEGDYIQGSYYVNNVKVFEGKIKAEPDISFYYIDKFTFALESGYTILPNGIRIYSQKYDNNLPANCSILYYPNGDKIESCAFKYLGTGVNGQGTYYWSNGSKYEGEFIDNKITKKGYFIDGNGNKSYGSFPKVSSNNDDFIGLALLGLAAYGVYELFTVDKTDKNNAQATNTQQSQEVKYTPTTSSSSTYGGSYSTQSSSNKTTETPKCSACGGRGVCLQCNGRGTQLCKSCDGKGTEKVPDDARNGTFNWYMKDAPCSKCSGSGIKKCNSCSGKGTCYRCYGKGTSY